MSKFPYKSFCWRLGTTSFRTQDFNQRIENQLVLLKEFKGLTVNVNKLWADLQTSYYRFMQERGFVKGDAPNPAKDAREKTSGLVDIGLIDNERNLTEVGEELYSIAQKADFSRSNMLLIPKDSFIYLKQLLKTYCDVDRKIVRPFTVTAYLILSLDYLTKDEFTYLLPLCTTCERTEFIVTQIRKLRREETTIDEVIISMLMEMENYKDALRYFLTTDINERVICEIGINRKSGSDGVQAYDKPYHMFYDLLHKIVFNGDSNSVISLLEQSKKINGKAGTLWRKFLFKTTNYNNVKHDGLSVFKDTSIFHARTEGEFRRIFFIQLHLFKAKATLSDYADLNQRYLKTTDTILFNDSKVELDILPKCWLGAVTDNLLDISFVKNEKLDKNIELQKISPFLIIDERKLYTDVERVFGIKIKTTEDVHTAINKERYKRFNKMIDERFGRDVIIDLLNKFEKRDDKEIRNIVTNNADIPTIFEYILGIIWYLISDRKGDVLEYMNLSLEVDLLPRTHAQGGNADIEYIYEQTVDYPAHCLLLEATLADKNTQRRMEMEPVSRHLGEYILTTGDNNAYCVFASTFLHQNVISDFRNRTTYKYYSDSYENCVNGLKILPLATKEIKTIIKRDIKYSELYSLFENAYQSEADIPKWYKQEILSNLSNIV